MNLNWDSLLEPIFLFILSLIAGTLWVIIPTNQNQHVPPVAPVAPQAEVRTVSLQRKPAVVSPLAVEASGLKKASAELGTSIQTLQERSQLTYQELAQLQEENRQSIIQIESEKKTLEKLTEEVKTLETQPSRAPNRGNSVVQPNREMTAKTEALRKVLAEKEGEVHRLQAQLEVTKARPESEIPPVPTATPANKLPVLLELIHNRAVPFNKEFYRSKGKLFGPTIIERRSEGETIAEIGAPDSAFNAMLKKLHPDKQYISCLLNSDSFPIFREVRRLLQAKHIDLGWEPMDTSSGKITVYPVHLTKKAETPKADVPRVPPIMR